MNQYHNESILQHNYANVFDILCAVDLLNKSSPRDNLHQKTRILWR